MNFRKNILFYITSILLIICTLSCEVGLGEAVDTEEPKISIETPPVDAIIRDKFAIGGTWADDGQVDKVLIELRRTDGVKVDPIKFKGTPVTNSLGKGTWSLLVEPIVRDEDGNITERKIKDGKYEIVSTVYDKAGHYSKGTRLITIDNTAPLIVLDRPASRPDTTPEEKKLLDAYGRKLSILGRAADDNNVDSIDINFYKDNLDEPIHTVRKTGVSNTIDETVAVFGDENYRKIYGDAVNGTAEYTCSIKAYDKARKYPEEYPIINVPKDDDLLGNMADNYYLFSELSSNLLNDYTVSELYKMLSGNYQSVETESNRAVVADADKVNEIINQLLNKKVIKGKFTLNPENNPTYSVSGFQPVTSQDDYEKKPSTIQSGTRLSLEVAPGIDGYALKKPFNTSATDDQDNYEIKLYPCAKDTIDIDQDAIDKQTKKVYTIMPEETKFVAGSYKLVVPIPGIPFDKYILKVEGKDSLGNDLIAYGGGDNKYVFNYVPLNIPPVLNVEPSKPYCNGEDLFVITGTVSSSGGVPTVKFKLGKSNKELSTKDSDTNTGNYLITKQGAANLYEFKCTLKISEFLDNTNKNDGQKTVTVIADSGNNLTASKDVEFIYDTTAPNVQSGGIEVLEPKKINGQNWYKTEQIKVKVSSIDEKGSGIDKVEAGIDTNNDNKADSYVIFTPREAKTSGGSTSTYFDGYVTVPNANGKNSIYLKLTDKAGNSNEFTETVFIDTSAPETINLISVDNEYKSPISGQKQFAGTKLVNGKNDVKVVISATDTIASNGGSSFAGSGIEKVILKKLVNKRFDTDCPEAILKNGNYEITITGTKDSTEGMIPTSSGSGSVEFEIIDKVGNKTSFNAFNMTVDTVAPSTKINPLQDADISTLDVDVNKIINITGTSGDNNGVAKIQLQYSTNNSDWHDYGSAIEKNKDNSLSSWAFEVNTEDSCFNNGPTYYFRALTTDDAGNNNSEIKKNIPNIGVKINQDSDRPVISFTNIDENKLSGSQINFDNTKLFGTVTDDDGVAEFFYKVENSKNQNPVWQKLELGNGGTWNLILDQGEQVIKFKVVDKGSDKEIGGSPSDDRTFESDDINNKVKIAGMDASSLSIKVDTIAPAIRKIKYQVVDDTANFVSEDPETGSKWKQLAELSEDILGGTKKKYLYFKVPATDDNGISSIVLEGNLTSSSGTDTINCNVETGISTPIDISTFKNDVISDSVSFPLSLTVTDGAGKTTEMDITLRVDNKAPVLTVDSHKPGDNVRSDFLLKGLTDDANCKIEYVITGKAGAPQDWAGAREYNIPGNRMSWGIHFDKKSDAQTIAISPDERMHDLNPKEYFFNVYKDTLGLSKNDNGAIITTANNELYKKLQPLYFHFRLTDELGNSSVNNDFNLIVDPQGGMPVVKLTYPTLTAEGEAPTVSGTIRLQGTADDDKQITAIYMQLFTGKLVAGTNNVDSNSLTEMTRDQYGSNYTVEDLNGKPVIKVGEGLTWNFNINEKGDFNGADGSINVIALKLFAQDDEGQISEETAPFALKIDSTSPRIGSSIPFTLNQYKWVDGSGNFVGYSKTADGGALYDDAGCNSSNGKNSNGNHQAFNTIDYESGMWLKGTWWLNGSVEDESGIASITVNNSDIPAENKKEYKNTSVQTSGFEITCKIDYSLMPDGEIKIVATDKDSTGGKTSTEIFNVKYDDTAPTISDENKDNTSVINDNGFFTLKSSATEEGSGFDRAVFYFTSRDKNTVYDSYIKKGVTGQTLDKISDKLVEDMGLFWRKESGTVSGNTITLTKTNPNIHVGGLIKLKGALYTIGNISGSAVTVTTNIPEIKGSTDVYFAIGHVVDHWGTETPGSTFETNDNYYGYYKDIPDDDKDRMVEKVSEIGNKITWNGSINSNNIPDGPVSITYVVFDKAGNYSSKTITGKAENNAPRLASLGIWSNYNRDKVQDEGEVDTFYFSENDRNIGGQIVARATKVTKNLIVSGNKLGPETIDGKTGSAYKTIKDEFAFIPEIVGGNGQLWYTYDIGGNKPQTQNGQVKFINGRFDGIDDNGNDNIGYLKLDGGGSIYVEGYKGSIPVTTELLNKLNNSVDSNNPTWFTYTISDSTGTTGETTYDSSTSLSAVFNVALNVQYKDSEKPTVSIKPFYWNSNTDNSISGNNPENGHIELSGDLDSKVFLDTNNSGLFDRDAKVSGRIKIEGTAADNIKLKELYVTFPGINGGKRLLVASYDADKGTWTSNKDASGKWTFTATDGEHKNAQGEPWHNVNWTFDVDTTIVGVNIPVGLDKVFEITAKDERGNNNAGLVSETNTKSKLQMDVVPYIIGVNTSLSKLKKNNPSVYGRTAKGHYPVAADEEVIFVGFNLGGATYKPSSGAAISLTSAGANDCVAGFSKGKSFVKLPVNNITTSGPIELNVANIKTLNNYNNNEAKGGAKDKEGATITLSENNYKQYAYNRQPNGDNNNLLTDDVYFDVWQLNKEAAIVKQAGYIVEPIMKINPQNDMVSFAFNNGPAYFSMPNGQKNSYTLWQRNYARNTTTGFTIDSNGVSHGITVGLDTNPNSHHAGRMTYMCSNWGIGDNSGEGGNYNGTNTSRLESIGVPAGTYNNVYYDADVFLEDRFKSPSLATIVRDSDTYVYLAYYDDLNQQIRFRWGNNTRKKKGTGITFNQFADQSATNNGIGSGDNSVFESNASYYSVVADNSKAANAGEYVSIAVVPGTSTANDVVVMTWYDATNQAWMYSYKVNPNNDKDMGVADSWVTPVVLKENAGQHCKITVDGKNGIHIAAQDSFNSDLNYIYLPSYSSTSNVSVKTVDAAGLTGSNITLDVAIKGNFIIPYIGYYSESIGKPKVAYLPDAIPVPGTGSATTVTVPDGDLNESFTGSWECSVVPTTSQLRNDYINVGVWKDTTGTWKTTIAKTNSSISGDTGKCYGNGTQNPILGYATKIGTSGRIETAQMK